MLLLSLSYILIRSFQIETTNSYFEIVRKVIVHKVILSFFTNAYP